MCFMNLLDSFGNTRGGRLVEALYNICLLRSNVLVFVMHTEDENCLINNSHYILVHTAEATPLGKGKKKIAIPDQDKNSDAGFHTSHALYSTMY